MAIRVGERRWPTSWRAAEGLPDDSIHGALQGLRNPAANREASQCQDVLFDQGLPLAPGQRAFYVSDMTPDGRTIVGALDDGPGTPEFGFRLVLPDACGFAEYGAGASPANVLTLTGSGPTAVGTAPVLNTGGVTAPNAFTALALGEANLALAGGIVLVDPTTVVAVLKTPAAGGQASLPLPVSNDPNLAGAVLHFQSMAFDATQPGWLALSNGLELTICPLTRSPT